MSDYKPLDTYGPEDKITPPDVQTRAVNSPPVGETLNLGGDNAIVSDDRNEELAKAKPAPAKKTK